jgi:hypothetical protein
MVSKIRLVHNDAGGTLKMSVPTGGGVRLSHHILTYEEVILSDNPLAYWPLTEARLDIGSIYHDITRHGYDARLQSDRNYGLRAGINAGDQSVILPATLAGATNGYLTHHTVGLPYDGEDYTIEMWMYYESGSFVGLFAWGPPNTGSATSFVGYDLSPAGVFTVYPGLSSWGTVPGVVSNWNHLVIAATATTQRWYWNNVLRLSGGGLTANGLTYSTANVLSIGNVGKVGGVQATPFKAAPPIPFSNPFTGSLAHVVLYKHELTADRVAAHYFARTP